jgi:hypothetical protein
VDGSGSSAKGGGDDDDDDEGVSTYGSLPHTERVTILYHLCMHRLAVHESETGVSLANHPSVPASDTAVDGSAASNLRRFQSTLGRERNGSSLFFFGGHVVYRWLPPVGEEAISRSRRL